MEQMNTMLKNLSSGTASVVSATPVESYNQVNHDYPKNTSPMPHINHSGNVPHFDGTHFFLLEILYGVPYSQLQCGDVGDHC